jgi:L-asparaginase
MKLLVLAIGGTIDKVYFDALSDYQIGTPAATEILQRVKVNFDFEVRQMISKDRRRIKPLSLWALCNQRS